MFGTIRKHQTWLWGVIITLTIISFVVFFSPYAKMNPGARAGNHGSINGKKISDQQFLDAWREVHLHHLVTSGRWPDEDKKSGFDPERETYNWMLIVQRQEDLGVRASDEATEQMARQLVKGFERMGVNSPQVFLQQILKPRGYQVEDFERFVRHFLGIQELITTVGLSGRLIAPEQAKALFVRDHTELATEAVVFWTTNYEAGVTIAPDVLEQFYTNRMANYMIPDRVQVNYVGFPVSNYLAQAEALLTNLNEIVDMNLQRMGTNLVSGATTPEENKVKVREQVIRQQGLYLARAKALEFANVLFTITPVKAEAIKALAASNNLPVQAAAPFDRDTGPKDLEVGADFIKAAFALTAEEPFSPPLVGQEGVYVLALDRQLPHETPALALIRDRVTADFKRGQAARLAYQSANAFSVSLTNALAQGRTFTNACADAGVKPVALPPFSISTRSLKEIEELAPLAQVKQAAFSTSPGKPSQVVPTAEGALVLFVKAKLPLDPAREQTELAAYVAQLRRTRQQEAFDEWLRHEADQGLRDTPIAKPRQPPVMGTKTAGAKS
jgi:hypothetical protein